MRQSVFFAAATVLLSSCHESEPSINVTETRRLTYFDKKPPGNIVDFPPLGWRAIPSTRFRDVNFLAGPDDSVEIYISNATGAVLENANRWLGQFGASPVPDESGFGTIEIIGRPASVVEAEGSFNPGMGGQGGENFALVGIIRPTGDSLLTIKMVGPADAVIALRPEFMTYCETLKTSEITKVKSPEPTTPES